MKTGSTISKPDQGAALLLALWALFLLSAMVITWALNINSRLTSSSNANRVVEAEAMASSGAEIALNPTIKPDSQNLHMKFAAGEKFDVQMTGECGRLNLNFLTQGEDPTKLAILRQYLSLKGIELNDLDTMMDSLLDWVSPNTGLHHLNAPEETDDYHPAHAPLTSVEDLKKVFGWGEFTSRPGWDEDFTINSSGPIDLAWASRDVLRALPGMKDDLVDRFLQLRRGPDGVDGTADDTPFKDISDIQYALGFSPEQFQQLAGLIGFNDQVYRIMSVGKSGDSTRAVQMVVRKTANVPQVIAWKEL